MTVLYVMKWNINPDKAEEYPKWTQSSIQKTLGIPGVVEFRAYRGPAGDSQVIATYEFADMKAWAEWQDHEDVKRANEELYTVATNVKMELWGPSPVVPKPIRPGG